MSGLGEIIARLEKATGPDRAIDEAIAWLVKGWGHPAYTASLDSALTLARDPDEHFDMLKTYVTVGRNTGDVQQARNAAIIYAIKARQSLGVEGKRG